MLLTVDPVKSTVEGWVQHKDRADHLMKFLKSEVNDAPLRFMFAVQEYRGQTPIFPQVQLPQETLKVIKGNEPARLTEVGKWIYEKFLSPRAGADQININANDRKALDKSIFIDKKFPADLYDNVYYRMGSELYVDSIPRYLPKIVLPDLNKDKTKNTQVAGWFAGNKKVCDDLYAFAKTHDASLDKDVVSAGVKNTHAIELYVAIQELKNAKVQVTFKFFNGVKGTVPEKVRKIADEFLKEKSKRSVWSDGYSQLPALTKAAASDAAWKSDADKALNALEAASLEVVQRIARTCAWETKSMPSYPQMK